jgi:hypothetical protein
VCVLQWEGNENGRQCASARESLTIRPDSPPFPHSIHPSLHPSLTPSLPSPHSSRLTDSAASSLPTREAIFRSIHSTSLDRHAPPSLPLFAARPISPVPLPPHPCSLHTPLPASSRSPSCPPYPLPLPGVSISTRRSRAASSARRPAAVESCSWAVEGVAPGRLRVEVVMEGGRGRTREDEEDEGEESDSLKGTNKVPSRTQTSFNHATSTRGHTHVSLTQ